MDTLISAVASDLVSRFISFLIQKYGKKSTTTEAEGLERLRCVLLRISTVVEEAEARRITNRGMILQLKGLMEGMYLGYYVLDTFKFESHYEEEGGVLEDLKVSDHKRLRSSTSTRSIPLLAFGSDSESTTMLKNVLASLEVKISDLREFVMLLSSCPRLPQQLYSTYLFMDKCMFGRHAEREQVISFLLHDDQNLAILPIIGPHRTGKKTLVHHACQDQGVRDRFPHTVFIHGDDLRNSSSLALSRKCLFIVEFGSWDVDVEAWEAFQSSLYKAAGYGSKVIIIGRTDDEIAKWGTASPIRPKSLSREEYWYYFKALAFGSMDPDEHPKLASLGMQLATELKGSFLGANILGQVLRGNPNTEIWHALLMSLREMAQKRFFLFGGDGGNCPEGILERNNRVGMTKVSFMNFRGCRVSDLREADHVQSELPRLTSEGPQMEGKFPCAERFDVLVWRSRIPPFCDYIATFEKHKPRRIVRRKNHLAVGNCKNDLA